MVKKLLGQINVFYVFRLLGILVGGFVLLCIVLFLTYFFEPRNDLGMQKLEVIETRWTRSIGTSGVGPPNFKAEVLLPNEHAHEFTTQPNFIHDDSVCAAVQFGRWFSAYHIQLMHPDACN